MDQEAKTGIDGATGISHVGEVAELQTRGAAFHAVYDGRKDGQAATRTVSDEKLTCRRMVLLSGQEHFRTHLKLAGHAVACASFCTLLQVLPYRDGDQLPDIVCPLPVTY